MIDNKHILKTKNNTYKFWTGRSWASLIKTSCKECNKQIYVHTSNFKKTGLGFCSKQCQMDYHQFLNDPKGYNILKNRTLDFYYLIGLICTDGYVVWPGNPKTVKSSFVEITLQQQDGYILQKIKKLFGGQIKNVTRKNNKKYIRWCLCGPKFVHFLKDTVGITPNKSYTLNIKKWFNSLKEQEKNAFMRGVLDGDGCITIYNSFAKNVQKKYKRYAVSITSVSPHFLSFLKEQFDGYVTKTRFNFKTQNTLKFLSSLYEIPKTGTLFLERKYKKYLELQKL